MKMATTVGISPTVSCCQKKIDLLMKRLEEKETMKSPVHAIDARMTCKVCGEVGHSGNDCPEIWGEAAYINNGYCWHLLRRTR